MTVYIWMIWILISIHKYNKVIADLVVNILFVTFSIIYIYKNVLVKCSYSVA